MDRQPSTSHHPSNRFSLDPRGNRHQETSQAENINSLGTSLSESDDNPYATTQSKLDYYFRKSIMAGERIKKLEAELREKDEEKNKSHKRASEISQENERLRNLMTEKSESERIAQEEVLRNDDYIRSLQDEIEQLRSEHRAQNGPFWAKRKLQEKDKFIWKLKLDLRNLRAEKDSTLNRLDRKTSLEEKLRRNIREKERTIEILHSEIAETSREKERKIWQLESALNSVQNTSNLESEERETQEKSSACADESSQLIADLEKALREQDNEISKYKEGDRLILKLVKKLGVWVQFEDLEKASPLEMLTLMMEKVESRLEQCVSTFKQLEVELAKPSESAPPTCSKTVLLSKVSTGPQGTAENMDIKLDPDSVVKREIEGDEDDVPPKKQKLSGLHVTDRNKTNTIKLINISSDEEVDIEN